jgi:REP element-mobilizing transposase RayT
MPEHVHLLIEPERSKLSVAIQMLKQITSQSCVRNISRAFGRSAITIFGMERSETHREAAVHPSQSGAARTGGEARGLDME